MADPCEVDLWELPQSRYQVDGSAELGGGIIPKDAFVIVTPDESKACGCTCKISTT